MLHGSPGLNSLQQLAHKNIQLLSSLAWSISVLAMFYVYSNVERSSMSVLAMFYVHVLSNVERIFSLKFRIVFVISTCFFHGASHFLKTCNCTNSLMYVYFHSLNIFCSMQTYSLSMFPFYQTEMRTRIFPFSLVLLSLPTLSNCPE